MKKQFSLIFLLVLLIGTGFSQVSVTDDYITIDNDAGAGFPAIKTSGSNIQNGIEFTNGGKRWRIYVVGDGTFRVNKIHGSTFFPFIIQDNTFSNALVLAENGVGIGTDTPAAALHVNHSTADALSVGSRSGAQWGYFNVEKPDGFNRNISRWRDPDNTVVIIDESDSAYQMTVFGSALASGGSWVNSDKKLKTDVKTINDPLTKIKELEPKCYVYSKDPKYAFLNLPEEKQFGFMAQDIEKILPEVVRKSTFIDADGPQSYSHELYAINYSAIVPLLTGAIQEQQKQIEKLESEIRNIENNSLEVVRLSKENEELKLRLNSIEGKLNRILNSGYNSPQQENLNGAYLEQNIPNPFSKTTTIQYHIPETSRSSSILLYDQRGQQIKAFTIQHTGDGEIEVSTNNLGAGQYSYSLVIDGILIDTKKMIISE
jgi:hypothetical protein